MTAPTAFREAVRALPEPERNALYASIPLFVAMVAGADREFDDLEMHAAVDTLLAATDELGDEFRWSDAARVEFDHVSEKAREGDPALAERLAALRAAVEALPPAHAARYRAFVKNACLHLASASGSFFGLGESISEDEKVVLRKIIVALGIPLEHRHERERLGFS